MRAPQVAKSPLPLTGHCREGVGRFCHSLMIAGLGEMFGNGALERLVTSLLPATISDMHRLTGVCAGVMDSLSLSSGLGDELRRRTGGICVA